jgi:glycosyltransferase involved in cell wall biosynthesis
MIESRVKGPRSPRVLVNGRFLSQALSGVQRHALEMTRALVAGGYDVELAVPPDARIPDELVPFACRIGRLRGQAWEQRDLASFAGSHRAPLWSPGNTGPVRVKRQLVTLHDLFPYRFPDFHSRAFRVWYRSLHRALVLRGVRFAAVSQYTRDEIVSLLGVTPERVAIVPGGVTPEFRPIAKPVADRTALRLGLPPRFVMTLAAASRRKNLERLVDAWQLVRVRDQGIELVLAGGTVDRRLSRYALPDRAWLAGRGVCAVEHIPEADLPAVYNAATALAMPSLAEGFGLPALEALCCGTPVVVSANSALVETFGQLGASLVDPYDVRSIADGIMRVLASPSVYRPADPAAIGRQHAWSESAGRLIAALDAFDR